VLVRGFADFARTRDSSLAPAEYLVISTSVLTMIAASPHQRRWRLLPLSAAVPHKLRQLDRPESVFISGPRRRDAVTCVYRLVLVGSGWHAIWRQGCHTEAQLPSTNSFHCIPHPTASHRARQSAFHNVCCNVPRGGAQVLLATRSATPYQRFPHRTGAMLLRRTADDTM
jgi:hypothetical protein